MPNIIFTKPDGSEHKVTVETGVTVMEAGRDAGLGVGEELLVVLLVDDVSDGRVGLEFGVAVVPPHDLHVVAADDLLDRDLARRVHLDVRGAVVVGIHHRLQRRRQLEFSAFRMRRQCGQMRLEALAVEPEIIHGNANGAARRQAFND